MRKSRLSKNFEKRSRKTLFLSIIGIIIVLFLVLRFGLDILVNFSSFISGSKGSTGTSQTNQINFIPPPILNPLVAATNSANIVITGQALKDQTIYLYLNNSNIDQTQTDTNGGFSFNEVLKNGDNQIEVKAESQGKQSDFSNLFDVVLKTPRRLWMFLHLPTDKNLIKIASAPEIP